MHWWPWKYLVGLQCPGAAAGSALVVVLRGGHRIEVGRGFDTGSLGQLVRVLEGV
jgi:hypothetical protein